MKKKYFILILLISLLMAQSIYAVPAFARRYKMSCTTCHDPFPRLKPYGDEFAGNGFVIPEEEKERDYISAGDDLLWLNRTFPVAIRMEAYAVAGDATDVNNDLQMPWGLKLLSGGTLAKNIGYYFYMYMSERGEVVGLEDAYIHFNNVFKTNLDIMTGQFQVCDPLMKRELRLTFEDYIVYKQKIGDSHTNLAYDRGAIFAYGIDKTGTDIVAMVVNGNGIPHAGDDKLFDHDKYKNIALRLGQGIGEHLGVGGFYYMGKELLINNDVVTTQENEISYMGVDGNLTIDRFSLTGQFMLRNDSAPVYNSSTEYSTNGIVGELVFSPNYDQSRFYYTLIYNRIDSEWDSADYHTLSISNTYLIARNIRLITEYTRDLEQDANRFVMGVVSAF